MPSADSPWMHRFVAGPTAGGGGWKVAGGNNGDDDDNGGVGGDGAWGVRGCTRKRLRLYDSLTLCHAAFLDMIAEARRLEESGVIDRIESLASDPHSLERRGHALFDVHPRRRGNIFGDEVYRLENPRDATTTFHRALLSVGGGGWGGGTTMPSPLPPNHGFLRNDVVMLTLQPRGTGDFLGLSSLPTAGGAVTAVVRVLGVGPAYVDVAIPPGRYASAFGPLSNNDAGGGGGRGDPNLRVRVDRFFSDVPYRTL